MSCCFSSRLQQHSFLHCFFSALTNKPLINHGCKPSKIQNCMSQNKSQTRATMNEVLQMPNTVHQIKRRVFSVQLFFDVLALRKGKSLVRRGACFPYASMLRFLRYRVKSFTRFAHSSQSLSHVLRQKKNKDQLQYINFISKLIQVLK